MQDRPVLFDLFKRVVYAKSTDEYNINVDSMKDSDVYDKYENFKHHVESKLLPRKVEWSNTHRYENKLPTHNQNTTNYVEYSFRMTKDVQFNRMRAYNIVDLLEICLDDSSFYTQRCLDISHNREALKKVQKNSRIFHF